MGSDGYGLCSRFYDRALEPMNAPLRRVAHRMWPPQPGWTVLDIGCGTGAALAEYAAAGCAVIGIDTSPAMVDAARQRLGPEADPVEREQLTETARQRLDLSRDTVQVITTKNRAPGAARFPRPQDRPAARITAGPVNGVPVWAAARL